ncbi:unnamed protein product [Lactuca saligna]|uniref:Uncharacterized protein n=1 Tax=Lactuca saligna TaxID=75948 RepID=A0AA36EJ81_LACSI|nr:unnamed protein product [Lactuca saligna]
MTSSSWSSSWCLESQFFFFFFDYNNAYAASISNIEGFKAEDHWHYIANGFTTREGDKCPTVDVFFLWVLTSTEVYADLPFHLADFLTVRAAKDRRGSPLNGGMWITQLAQSFGIFEKWEASLLTVKPQKTFSTLLYKRAQIVVGHGMVGFSIPDDTPRHHVPIRGRQRGNEAEAGEPVIPGEDEMPMDPYSMARRRYKDYMSSATNYTNMSLDHLMSSMCVSRPEHFPSAYPHVPTWGDIWREQLGGAGGSGGGASDEAED